MLWTVKRSTQNIRCISSNWLNQTVLVTYHELRGHPGQLVKQLRHPFS